MFTPDRASAAIADYNLGRKRRCYSLDEVAKDLGLALRPKIGALAWVDQIIVAVENREPAVAGVAGVAGVSSKLAS